MNKYPYSRCITNTCDLNYWKPKQPARFRAVEEWLRNNVEYRAYTFGFEDYGQHGEYVVRFTNQEDLTAFILACENTIHD